MTAELSNNRYSNIPRATITLHMHADVWRLLHIAGTKRFIEKGEYEDIWVVNNPNQSQTFAYLTLSVLL